MNQQNIIIATSKNEHSVPIRDFPQKFQNFIREIYDEPIFQQHFMNSDGLIQYEKFGQRMLQGFIQQLRANVRGCNREIQTLQRQRDFLKDHSTLDSLQEYARRYATLGEHEEKWDEDIRLYVPDSNLIEQYRNRQTNLNVCGWCRFCQGGWCQGGCHLKGHCVLLSLLCDDEGSMGKTKYDRPCILIEEMQRNPLFVSLYIGLLEDRINYLKTSKSAYIRDIHALTHIKNTAEDTPVLTPYAHHADYPERARVVVLANMPERQDSETASMPLFRGTVVPSKYRHPDLGNHPKLIYRDYRSYMASICADVQMSNYPAVRLDADSGMSDRPWYAVGGAMSMLEDDFRYLCDHPEYRWLWLRALDTEMEHYPAWVKTTWAEAFARGSVK